ncbi:MAG: glycosyltransferase [Anaerolineae bacterium]|nr:glycosyltransferase [Anaerolineae bacterium]
MRCPTLADLPPPPSGRTGWPWTAESSILLAATVGGAAWPQITIVTPSFNQSAFIEATIRSVLLQGYPNLEYIIIDGGSTDGSVEIIRRYEPWLTYWVSEPDRGQYDALNKGFAKATGQVLAWLNSDDMYVLNSLSYVGEIFATFAGKVKWLTGVPALWNEQGLLCAVERPPSYRRELIRLGLHDGRGLGWIQQESSFWSCDLWLAAGGQVDASLDLAADFDLWRRFANYADLYTITVLLGGFRVHYQQKTALHFQQHYDEIDRTLARSQALYRFNRLVKTKWGLHAVRWWLRLNRATPKVISYNTRRRQWEIGQWVQAIQP